MRADVIRLGMVGGGQGAFIGEVHRLAARLDGHYCLVAGAFSSNPEISKKSGEALGIAPERVYGSFEEMAKAEAKRADGINAVAIVTPNHLHYSVAKAFLEVGIHVICDKPVTSTLEEALLLNNAVAESDAKFMLTHTYSGYPMVREAKRIVASGELGTLRMVQVEYAQGWLAEEVKSKQADWRADPSKAGIGGCIGDIGTHAYHLARFISGLEVEAVSADLTSFVPGRVLDDNANVMMRFKGGARGMLWASQVAIGCDNGLSIRLFGEKGAIEWRQEAPNDLWLSLLGQPTQKLTRGGVNTQAAVRVPAGHPEGYIEAFASLYDDFAQQLNGADVLVPDMVDGLDGMRFVYAAVRSSQQGGSWESVSV